MDTSSKADVQRQVQTERRKSYKSRMIIKEGITSTGQALEKAKTLFRHDPARKQVLVLITGKL